MPKKNAGFTLLELLCVIAIVSLLLAVLLPALVRARRDAHRATCASNLRQCGLALTMYCDDNGGFGAMPTYAAVTQVLSHAPTCDPEDTWRTGCQQDFGAPLIGSYAYVLAVPPFSDPGGWHFYRLFNYNPTLMISIYYADTVPDPYHSLNIPDIAHCRENGCMMPDRVLRLHLDGSVTFSATGNSGGRSYMGWQSLFLEDSEDHHKGE